MHKTIKDIMYVFVNLKLLLYSVVPSYYNMDLDITWSCCGS